MARCDSAMMTAPLIPYGLNAWMTTSTMVACARFAASTITSLTKLRLLMASASQSKSSNSRCRPNACILPPPLAHLVRGYGAKLRLMEKAESALPALSLPQFSSSSQGTIRVGRKTKVAPVHGGVGRAVAMVRNVVTSRGVRSVRRGLRNSVQLFPDMHPRHDALGTEESLRECQCARMIVRSTGKNINVCGIPQL